MLKILLELVRIQPVKKQVVISNSGPAVRIFPACFLASKNSPEYIIGQLGSSRIKSAR